MPKFDWKKLIAEYEEGIIRIQKRVEELKVAISETRLQSIKDELRLRINYLEDEIGAMYDSIHAMSGYTA